MKKVIYFLAMCLLVVSCASDSKGGGGKKGNSPDNFNRKEMLTFWADKIIIPGYADFSSKTKSLEEAVTTFTITPSVENLTKARSAWKEAYIVWQKVSLFQIGKAQEENMTGSMNTYPTDTEAIKTYATKQNYNFESPNLNDKQGFPALDYLLNGQGTNQKTINFYTKAKNASKYKKYLKDVAVRINLLTSKVYKSWTNGYRNTFINNDGYTATSSVDKLVNFYVIPFYEKQFRENKIATPAGVRTGTAAVEKVEAYYAKNISKDLYITTLNATKNFFQGKSYSGAKTGKSLQQYLEFLNRQDLATTINTKFNTVITLSNTLNNSFIVQIETDRTKMLDTFDAIQAVLKSFKPDMMSAMSVMNSSTDTDND